MLSTFNQILASSSSIILGLILIWIVYQLVILLVGVRFHNMRSGQEIVYYPKFSIIIPVKNEEKVIGRTLKSILNLNYPRNRLEILIVDGSTDSTSKICEEFKKVYPDLIKIIKDDVSKGKPTALNISLKQVNGEIVAVFDADSLPEKNILLNVAAHFQDPNTLAVQGRTLCINKNYNLLTKLQAVHEDFFHLLIKGREALNLFVPFTGNCLFIRKDVLEELGGWKNDSLAEDVELSARLLLNRAARVKYAENVILWQEAPSRLQALIRQKGRWYRGYIETAIEYAKLLKKPSLKNLETEVFLAAPLLTALSFIGYIAWIINLTYPTADFPLPLIGYLIIVMTFITIILTLIYIDRPPNFRNLSLAPFLYVYWILQSIIILKSLFEIILRRPRKWLKTEKEGLIAR